MPKAPNSSPISSLAPSHLSALNDESPAADPSTVSLKETIAIIGCGWLGLAVAQRLAQLEVPTIGTTTTPARLKTLRASGADAVLLRLEPIASASEAQQNLITPALTKLFNSSKLIFTIPPSGFDAPEPYLEIIRGLIERWQPGQLKHFLLISSTSVYGASKGEIDENSPTLPETTSATILQAGEREVRRLGEERGFVVSVLRSAGQMGFGRHPGRFLAGRTEVKDPELPVNMIHQTDLAECAVQILLQTEGYPENAKSEPTRPAKKADLHPPSQSADCFEIYNAAAQTHPHREDFYSEAAMTIGLPPPQFAPQSPEARPGKRISSAKIRSRLQIQFRYDDLMAFVRGKIES